MKKKKKRRKQSNVCEPKSFWTLLILQLLSNLYSIHTQKIAYAALRWACERRRAVTNPATRGTFRMSFTLSHLRTFRSIESFNSSRTRVAYLKHSLPVHGTHTQTQTQPSPKISVHLLPSSPRSSLPRLASLPGRRTKRSSHVCEFMLRTICIPSWGWFLRCVSARAVP